MAFDGDNDKKVASPEKRIQFRIREKKTYPI